jgi:hypothetical protein
MRNAHAAARARGARLLAVSARSARVLARVRCVRAGASALTQRTLATNNPARSRRTPRAAARAAGLIDDVTGLADADLAGLLTWRDFYHKDYSFVGLLAGGSFYDASGKASPLVGMLDAAGARVAASRASAAAAERAAPACNAAWSAAEGGRVWCDEQSTGGGVPRRVTLPPEHGESADDAAPRAVRCACMRDATRTVATDAIVELYPGCHPDATSCATSPPTAAHAHATHTHANEAVAAQADVPKHLQEEEQEVYVAGG